MRRLFHSRRGQSSKGLRAGRRWRPMMSARTAHVVAGRSWLYVPPFVELNFFANHPSGHRCTEFHNIPPARCALSPALPPPLLPPPQDTPPCNSTSARCAQLFWRTVLRRTFFLRTSTTPAPRRTASLFRLLLCCIPLHPILPLRSSIRRRGLLHFVH